MAVAEIDDHARVGVFAEEIRVFRLEFLHRLVEFGFEQFGGGSFGLGDVGGHGPPTVTDSSPELHLHDFGLFALEVIVDGFDEAIGKLLHFILNIVQAVLG